MKPKTALNLTVIALATIFVVLLVDTADGVTEITETEILARAREKAHAKGGTEALAQHIYRQDFDLLAEELRKERTVEAWAAAVEDCNLCDNRGWAPNVDDSALDRCTHPGVEMSA